MDKRTNEERSWKKSLENDFPQRRGNWIVHERETWNGKYSLKVHHDRVTRPDGNPGVYEWIEIKSGVSILPIDTEKNVYLAKGFQYGVGKDSLELAGGGLDNNETFEQAARRELQEELGIKTYKLIDLGSFDQMTGLLYSPQRLFMAKDIEIGKANQETTEKIIPVKIRLEEAVSKVMAGEIFDGPAIATILKANEYLRTQI